MTPKDMKKFAGELKECVNMLDSLSKIDRMADCSDRYFRQVCTAKINALRASGIRERLLDVIAEMTKTDKESEE